MPAGDREVALLGRVEFLRLAVVHDRAHDDGAVSGRQRPWLAPADLAVDLDGGGKPAVMKRSEPFFSTIFFSSPASA
jgi:hypothetical protein